MKTGIIFDVDGTLWDSSEAVAKLWAATLSKYPGITRKCDRDAMLQMMGKPMDAIGRYFMPDFDEETRSRILKECETEEVEGLKDNLPKSYEGVHDTLVQLSETYPLFIVSNCQVGYIELCMESAKIADIITDYICFGDNEKTKDVNIRLIAEGHSLDNYYYVGDIQSDYDATIKAGGKFIHAKYGFGEINADVPEISDIRMLPEVVRKLENEAGKN